MRNLRLSLEKVGWSKMLRLTCLFLILSPFVSISEAKRSACWRYGHSCWGGHGKRSGDGLGEWRPVDSLSPNARLDVDRVPNSYHNNNPNKNHDILTYFGRQRFPGGVIQPPPQYPFPLFHLQQIKRELDDNEKDAMIQEFKLSSQEGEERERNQVAGESPGESARESEPTWSGSRSVFVRNRKSTASKSEDSL